MSEFGHFGTVAAGICLDTWGAGPFVINTPWQNWRFEDSDRFGPAVLNRQDDPASRQPSEKSPFWLLHKMWVQQGRKLAPDGIQCVLDLPDLRPPRRRRALSAEPAP